MRGSRQDDLVAEGIEVGFSLFPGIPLLRGHEQIAQGDMPRFPAGIRSNQDRSVGADGDFAAVRQRNMGVEINRHFGRRDSQPEQDCLQGKRRNDFATITKKERDMNGVGDFVRQICEPSRGN